MSWALINMLSRPDSVNVAHMVEHCRVVGPGNRFVIWVQGCPLCCLGYHNPQFQDFEDKLWLSVEKLASMVLETKDIEGVTYVGGEPFAQAQALASLSRKLCTAGLTVMTYSGFTFEELKSGKVPHAEDLLSEANLLLDGPYRHELPTNQPWRGSDNQRLISLSERYRERISEWNAPTGQQFELRLSSRGEVEVVGISPADLTGVELAPLVAKRIAGPQQ